MTSSGVRVIHVSVRLSGGQQVCVRARLRAGRVVDRCGVGLGPARVLPGLLVMLRRCECLVAWHRLASLTRGWVIVGNLFCSL